MVVTINYRLGPMGFFAHPALGADGADLGLQDQVEALRWVQRNAKAFDGDPGNVTIFGESAGAFNTCALVTSPMADGLIQRAIIHSGSCSVHFTKNIMSPGLEIVPYQPLQQNQYVGVAAAADAPKRRMCWPACGRRTSRHG